MTEGLSKTDKIAFLPVFSPSLRQYLDHRSRIFMTVIAPVIFNLQKIGAPVRSIKPHHTATGNKTPQLHS